MSIPSSGMSGARRLSFVGMCRRLSSAVLQFRVWVAAAAAAARIAVAVSSPPSPSCPLRSSSSSLPSKRSSRNGVSNVDTLCGLSGSTKPWIKSSSVFGLSPYEMKSSVFAGMATVCASSASWASASATRSSSTRAGSAVTCQRIFGVSEWLQKSISGTRW